MSEARQNAVRQLSELYNVVIGISISLAIMGTIDVTLTPIPIKLDHCINLFTFILIVVPFYHGAARHLFATYVEDGGSSRIKNGALLADFFLLFLEGCFFIALALLISETYFFIWGLVFLLALDCIWGLLAFLAFSGANAQLAEQKWAIINFIAAALLAFLLLLADDFVRESPVRAQIVFCLAVAVRTFIDYFFCWNFYFPPHQR